MVKKLLVATDGSERSQQAGAQAVALARALGAELLAITAVASYPYSALAGQRQEDLTVFRARAAAEGNERLTPIERAAHEAGVPFTALLIEEDDPARAIVSAAADRDVDLVVLASHGRRGLQGLLLGSETQKVLALASCPVLVLR